MKLAIDISYWQKYDLTQSAWDVLQTGIDGVIIRLGYRMTEDSMAAEHIRNCILRGLPYCGYWYVYPYEPINLQANAIIAAVAKYRPSAMWIDAEDYKYPNGEIIPPAVLDNYFRNLDAKVRASITVPVGVYSADWYINKYAPAMKYWVFRENYWEARYMAWYEASWWSALKKTLGINFPIEKMRYIAENVTIFRGVMRQIESKISVNGLPLNLDWNIITDQEFGRLFNAPVQIPELNFQCRVTAVFLTVRAAPPTNGVLAMAVGWKKYGDIVTVTQEINGWYRIDGGWVNKKYLEVTL